MEEQLNARGAEGMAQRCRPEEMSVKASPWTLQVAKENRP